VILLLLVVVVAAVAVVAAGVSAASGDDRADRSSLGGAGPSLLLLVGVVAVVVLGAAFVLVVGVRGGGDPEGEPAAADHPPTTAPPRPEKETGDSPLPPGTGPEVTITRGGSPGVLDRLPESAVVVVNAEGFKPGTGEVAQCGLGTDGAEGCLNRFPVEFGAEGTARFQYRVSDRVHEAERCGAGQRPCLLVVFGAHDEGQGQAFTVFHDPALPPGRITVEPRADLSDGDMVAITAAGFPPATPLHAAQCPLDIDQIPGACQAAQSTRTGPDGSAVMRFTVHTGARDGVACGWRQPCAIRVTAEAPVAPVTLPISFSAGPSARYHGGKLAGGLALAALLLALAWRLLRSTDWQEPAAAATPEMDRAVLDA